MKDYLDDNGGRYSQRARSYWSDAADSDIQEPPKIAAILMVDLMILDEQLRGIITKLYGNDRLVVLDRFRFVAMYFVDLAQLR